MTPLPSREPRVAYASRTIWLVVLLSSLGIAVAAPASGAP